MSDKRISELDAAGSLASANVLPIVQGSSTKRTTLQSLADWVVQTASSFTQSGSATSRSAAEKMRETVSAQDEGAVGNGATDNDAAFALVEDRAEDYIFLPYGNYLTDGEMTKKYFGPGKINGKKLYQFDRIQPIPQASRLWHKIRANAEDVQILILGDSTGNATDEWVYLWGTQLGADVPTHTIRYRLFTDGSGWGSESSIDTGSGSKSIYIDNCSIPGANVHFPYGENRADIYSLSRTYDLVIFSFGHNDGTSANYAAVFAAYSEAVIEAKQMNPRAVICATLQNPRTDDTAHSFKVVQAWREIGELHGLGLINVHDVFNALGNPAGLYTDATHPNAAGMRVWASVVNQALGESMTHQHHRQPQNSLIHKPTNYAPNPAFNEWDTSNPTSWSLTNATAAQDPEKKETFAYSVKLETTGASGPQLSCVMDAYVPLLRGKWVTFLARTWRTDGESTTGGRIQIQGTATAAVSSGISEVDGWCWHVAQAFIPTTETTLTIRVLCGTTVGNIIWVDRVSFVEGLLPADIDFNLQPPPEASEYFVSGNVGIPAGSTGSVSVSGNDVTLTGGTSPLARFYINVQNLIPGHQYNIVWTRADSTNGDVFIRAGQNGAGSNLTSASYESVATLTWTATRASETVLFAADSGMTGFDVDDIAITKVAMPAVTQATNKSTSVTLNTEYGEITLNNATLNSDTTVSFTLSNTTLTATDVLTLNHVSGGTIGAYTLNAVCAANQATVYVRNVTGGNLGEAVVIRFRKDE